MKRIYIGDNKKLCGVCDGIATYFSTDPLLVRIIAVSLALLTAVVPALVVYIAIALILPNPPADSVTVENYYKRLFRTASSDKKIFGVCGGFAKFFNIDPTLVRLIFALLVIWMGSGVAVYLACAIMMPSETKAMENQP